MYLLDRSMSNFLRDNQNEVQRLELQLLRGEREPFL